MRRTIFGILIFIPTLSLFSQEADFILSKFFATQVEDEVLIRWTITAGNTCQDTYVERSEDGISYERIGLIGGICGSPDASITYDYFDTMPLPNRETYYRLMLGQYGFTSPQKAWFTQLNDQGFLLAPNPFKESIHIAFENQEESECQLMVYEMQGSLIYETSTTSQQFIMNGTHFTSGLYFFTVARQGEKLFSGKVIKID